MSLSRNLSRRSFLLFAAALSLSACGRGGSQPFKLTKNTKILALGDSLTMGQGAPKGQDYPSVLAELTGCTVINSGIGGNRTSDVLLRLPQALAHKPDAVLLCLGVNNFLHKVPEEQTVTQMGEIIGKIMDSGAAVILLAAPYMKFDRLDEPMADAPIYKPLAARFGLPLLEHALSEVLSDKSLKADGIHANAAGYRRFAEKVAAFLQEL